MKIFDSFLKCFSRKPDLTVRHQQYLVRNINDIKRNIVSIKIILARIEKREFPNMSNFTQAMAELAAAVAENTTVDESMMVLATELKAKLDEARGDPQALLELAAAIRASSAKQVASLLANTHANPDTPDLPGVDVAAADAAAAEAAAAAATAIEAQAQAAEAAAVAAQAQADANPASIPAAIAADEAAAETAEDAVADAIEAAVVADEIATTPV